MARGRFIVIEGLDGAGSPILGLSLWRGWGGPWALSLLLFGMALAGFLYSVYLTYLELFLILAVCPWCVASALLMTGILVDSWRGLEVPAG